MSNANITKFVGSKEPKAKFLDYFKSHNKTILNYINSNILLTKYGRGAIQLLLSDIPSIKGRDVLLPAFMCPSVIQAIEYSGFNPVFYPLRPNLHANIEYLENVVDSNVAAVILVQYFGFESNTRELQLLCSDHGIPLIEDWSHSFLQRGSNTLAGGVGDFQIYSFWKIAACEYGGGIRCKYSCDIPRKLSRNSPMVCLRMIKDTLYTPDIFTSLPNKTTSDSFIRQHKNHNSQEHLSNDERYLAWYRENAGDYDKTIPYLSKRLLYTSAIEKIISVRRRNYQFYLDTLKNIESVTPLIGILPADTCPWVFPILLPMRSMLAPLLRESGVPLFTFGETLHPTQREFFLKNKKVYDSVMKLIDLSVCLPVHQNITLEMISFYIDRISALVNLQINK